MARQQPRAYALTTDSGVHSLSLQTASSFFARFQGLMLSAPLGPAEGLLITCCTSVHTAFMRYPIDVIYLDRNGVVIRCVPHLMPWRASHSAFDRGAKPHGAGRVAHVLELAAGAIAVFGIAPGDYLSHPCLTPDAVHLTRTARQRGAAMLEFAVVAPLIAMLGLGTLQYAMLFFAKNQINYAAFMAGREGSVANADLGAVRQAYTRALAPLYGGGESPAEVAEAVGKAGADVAENLRIELLNPTKESFSDWNDPALQTLLKTGSRKVIPNSSLATKPVEVKSASGQSLQDANLLKLRITHGYQPKVPFISKFYITYLKWLDPHNDSFYTKLVEAGRIPVVTHVTLQMHSDAIESGDTVSIPGSGNGGKPTNPGDPPVTSDPPPECTNLSCEVPGSTTPPPCNPFTDPNRCQSTPCVPNSQMCCIPPEWMPKT